MERVQRTLEWAGKILLGEAPLPKARGSLTSHSRGKNVQSGRLEKEACGGLAGEGAATEGELGGLQHPPSPLPTWCC